MTLREAIKWNRGALEDGIQWVAFYKEGRSWNSEAFTQVDQKGNNPIFNEEDINRMETIIVDIDRNAVLLNGYYTNCGVYDDGTTTLATMENGVRWNYDEGNNLMSVAMETSKAMIEASKKLDADWEVKNGIRADNTILYNAYRNGISGKPEDAIKAVVEQIGIERTVEVIGQLVANVGDWDQRVGTKNREWATDAIRYNVIGLTTQIHPCHIDQFASTLRRMIKNNELIEKAVEAVEEVKEEVKTIEEEVEDLEEAEIEAGEASDEYEEAVEMKNKIMELHKKLVKDQKYYAAKRVLELLINKQINLGLSDTDWEVSSMLAKLGNVAIYISRSGNTEMHKIKDTKKLRMKMVDAMAKVEAIRDRLNKEGEIEEEPKEAEEVKAEVAEEVVEEAKEAEIVKQIDITAKEEPNELIEWLKGFNAPAPESPAPDPTPGERRRSRMASIEQRVAG